MAKKKLMTTINSREELEAVLGEYCAAVIDRAANQLNLEKRINELRAQYETVLTELTEAADGLYADLQAWATLHPEEFAAKKSLDLLHGTLGFRSGTPAVKQLTGVKVDYTLGLVRADPELSTYTREKVELDKEKILGDFTAGKLTAEDLLKVGLRIERQESFFVQPAQEKGGE